MLRPSGVSSESEAICALDASSSVATPSAGMNSTARRLPRVIVPVLSSSTTSMSPAVSTALPLLAMMLASRARSIPAIPMAASSAPMVVGIRQTSERDQRRHVGAEAVQGLLNAQVAHHVLLGVPRHRPERYHDDQEDQRERGEDQRQRDFIGRPLALGALDERDHPVEERFAGLRRDLNHDSIGQDGGAAGHAGAVAARLADHRRRFAGDRRLVHRCDPFDHLAVAGNDLPCAHDHLISRPQRGGGNLLDLPLVAQAMRHRLHAGPAQRFGVRLAARLGQRRGEIRKKNGQEQPDIQRDEIAQRHLAGGRAEDRLADVEQGQEARRPRRRT